MRKSPEIGALLTFLILKRVTVANIYKVLFYKVLFCKNKKMS